MGEGFFSAWIRVWSCFRWCSEQSQMRIRFFFAFKLSFHCIVMVKSKFWICNICKQFANELTSIEGEFTNHKYGNMFFFVCAFYKEIHVFHYKDYVSGFYYSKNTSWFCSCIVGYCFGGLIWGIFHTCVSTWIFEEKLSNLRHPTLIYDCKISS